MVLDYAYKTCLLDSNTSEPVWSLTNYGKCFEEIICSETTCSIENHIDYIVMMRIVGYVASMLTLVLSIAILLRSRLRCPRNFVHINLFLAFSFRTILTMLVDINPEINSNQSLENKELTQVNTYRSLGRSEKSFCDSHTFTYKLYTYFRNSKLSHKKRRPYRINYTDIS